MIARILLATLLLAIALPADASSLKSTTLTGQVVEIGTARATAIVFIATDCPISNSYIPTLNTLAAKWSGQSVPFVGILSEPSLTRQQAADWAKSYSAAFPVIFDASGELARKFNPSKTPEAFVLARNGEIKYHGRINDAWAGLTHKRQSTSTNELDDALTAVVAGSDPKITTTDIVGCEIETWGKEGRRDGAVTWSQDIAPIIYANCAECHRPGEVAPFQLLTYQDVRKHAKQIVDVINDGIMPPWKPADGYGHFMNARGLTADERETIHRWVTSGAVEGDEVLAPPTPVWKAGWRLGEPDVVVKMSEPFNIPADGRDVYRAFVMPVDLKKDEMIVAYEFRPGNPKVVHHSLLFMDESGKARQLDAADPGPGWRSFGGPGFTPSGGLGGWAPGALAERLPDGIGRPIHKGADVVFQMHYHPDGKPEQDQSELALYFAKKPITQVVGTLTMGKRQIDIPAGDNHYTRQQSITLPEDITLVGIIPHMHLLGHEMKVTATSPDGKIIPLIWIKDWDFQWQGQYRYSEPLHLIKGTQIDMQASYDNSEANPNNPNKPPKEVHFGEQTTDEMCYCFFEVATSDASTFKKLRREIVTQQIMRSVFQR
ncbi:MAG TPA: redoxin domain-containing protein [Tepidisphaeraceae bacterium]|jgi:mono/diheme cytochrome c family protein|nr:redoxin domain-containing protein [Tepidisphaeraceae bacterium]